MKKYVYYVAYTYEPVLPSAKGLGTGYLVQTHNKKPKTQSDVDLMHEKVAEYLISLGETKPNPIITNFILIDEYIEINK